MSSPMAARRRRTAAALLSMLVVAGCGISVDESPRVIDASAEQGQPDEAVPAPETGGGATIYLVATSGDAQSVQLVGVQRDVAIDPAAVVAALFLGPSTEDSAEQLRSALPVDTELLGARTRGSTVSLNVSGSLDDLTSDALTVALAQIVYTASNLPGVTEVEITVDGQARQWPRGDGALRDGTLSIFDYPGFLPTTQPAFPPVPPAPTTTVG